MSFHLVFTIDSVDMCSNLFSQKQLDYIMSWSSMLNHACPPEQDHSVHFNSITFEMNLIFRDYSSLGTCMEGQEMITEFSFLAGLIPLKTKVFLAYHA